MYIQSVNNIINAYLIIVKLNQTCWKLYNIIWKCLKSIMNAKIIFQTWCNLSFFLMIFMKLWSFFTYWTLK